MKLTETAEKAIAAYGGRALWESAKTLETEISASGLAFTLKRRPFFRHARMVLDVHRPFSTLTPIGRSPSTTGVLDGLDVRLENDKGKVIAERKNAGIISKSAEGCSTGMTSIWPISPTMLPGTILPCRRC